MGAGIDSLADVMGSPMEITIGDKSLKISPLEMGDFGAAEAHIRAERLNLFLEQTRGINGVNLPADIRAKSFGEIMNSPIRINDILSDQNGLVFLVFRALMRGNKGITLEFVKKINADQYGEMLDIVMGLSGFNKKLEGEGPLDSQNTTSTTT